MKPLLLPLALILPAALHAEPTPVTFRVISADTKFIGHGIGGAKVVLRDADNGWVPEPSAITRLADHAQSRQHAPKAWF